MHAQFALQGLDLPQDQPRMVDDALAGRGQRHAAPVARQEGDAERLLHAADALACRGEGEIGAAGAVGDAAGLGDVKEKPQVDQIEAHGVPPSLRFVRRLIRNLRIASRVRRPHVGLHAG